MALSPWPTSPAALTNAREHLRRHIGSHEDEVLNDVGAAAAAYVERHAPGAPQAVRDEGVVRFSAWLVTTTDAMTKIKDGEMELETETNAAAMFRKSGAAGLLSPWKIRRAGAIG